MANNIWTPWIKGGDSIDNSGSSASGGQEEEVTRQQKNGYSEEELPCPNGLEEECELFEPGEDGLCINFEQDGELEEESCINAEDVEDEVEEEEEEEEESEEPAAGAAGAYDEHGHEYKPDTSEETKAREDMRDQIRGDENESQNHENQNQSKHNPENLVKDEAKLEETAEAAGILVESWPAILGGCATLLVLIAIIFIGFMIWTPNAPAAPATTSGTPAVICLDPGHFNAPGEPQGANGEDVLNLKVAEGVKTELQKRGYTVVMTREGSEHIALKDRAQKCVTGKASFMYAFHADGTPRSAGYPYQIFMHSSRKISSESKTDAATIQKEVAKQVSGLGGLTNGGIADESSTGVGTLQIFSGADALGLPAVLTEMVQLNANGSSALDDATTMGKFVTGVANGIQSVVPVNSGASGGAIAKQIVDQAKKYADNNSLYHTDMDASGVHAAKGTYNDCAGMVETIFWKLKIDQAFVDYGKNHQASELINYFKAHPEKYIIVSENLQSTSKLQPGDVLLNYKHGSHAAIYTGLSPHNTISASIGSNAYEPSYKNWYSNEHAAVRLK